MRRRCACHVRAHTRPTWACVSQLGTHLSAAMIHCDTQKLQGGRNYSWKLCPCPPGAQPGRSHCPEQDCGLLTSEARHVGVLRRGRPRAGSVLGQTCPSPSGSQGLMQVTVDGGRWWECPEGKCPEPAVGRGSSRQLELCPGGSLDTDGRALVWAGCLCPDAPTAASPALMVWGGGGWRTWGGTGSLVLRGRSCRPLPVPTEEVLESYENPPPIVLPSEGFQVDLEADCLDDSIYQHLLYIRHFLWSLRSKPSAGGGPSQPGGLEVPGAAGGVRTRIAGGRGQLAQGLAAAPGSARSPSSSPTKPGR